ncbi:hypothetical protein DUNSADRAFT_8652 [Dunaliella salina]|uniref:Secreted protein n=1 Tax=Dunaliella salina TaxID=3046 RepID=A0ABQ7GJA9_DUNSA|nr:hypothetical protein DUNSADRAFT_8652 [Dunaliella salina]|eukprot:KAF5834644.1 hypothetical protein DUNSADRAFT_8652 [Dunaliella salina]
MDKAVLAVTTCIVSLLFPLCQQSSMRATVPCVANRAHKCSYLIIEWWQHGGSMARSMEMYNRASWIQPCSTQARLLLLVCKLDHTRFLHNGSMACW